MADEHRFWLGAAASRDDAPQAPLEQLLLMLRDDEVPWATVDAILHARVDGAEAWKRWQRALTELHVRAGKAVHSARARKHLVDPEPDGAAELRRAGWEPFPELTRRLVAMWGTQQRVEEQPGRMRLTWERTHEGGRQAGQPVRCQVDVHASNPGWVRVRWASWREGMRAPRGTTAAVLGVDADAVFGAPAPATSSAPPAPAGWTDPKAGA